MISKVVKAELALCGKKMKDLILPLRERGYTVDAQRLSIIIGGTAAKTDYNLGIEKEIAEIIDEWKKEETK